MKDTWNPSRSWTGQAPTYLTEIVAEIKAIRYRQHQQKLHDPGCPADHNCGRDHPQHAVYHYPQPCSCWLSKEWESE